MPRLAHARSFKQSALVVALSSVPALGGRVVPWIARGDGFLQIRRVLCVSW